MAKSRKPTTTVSKPLEYTLWVTADKLEINIVAAEYKHYDIFSSV